MRVFAMLSLGTIAQREIPTKLGLRAVSDDGTESEDRAYTHYDTAEKPSKVVKKSMGSCQSRRY